MVDSGELRAILAGQGLMLHLVGCGLDVALVCELGLLRTGLPVDSAGAVIADVVDIDDGVLLDDGAVHIDIGDVNAAEVGARAVVCKVSAAPLAADEADATVAEAVVDAAIEADMRTPVTAVPSIRLTGPTPVTGSPEEARLGWLNPDARHPIVASVPIGPIARRPDEAGGRQRRLNVNGKDRWSEID